MRKLQSEDSVKFTAIVLAGGMSRRLGRDKAQEVIAGERMIDRIVRMLRSCADEIVVVVSDKQRERDLRLPCNVSIATDIYPNTGSLGGIYSGLNAATNVWCFVAACDMPFLNHALINYLISFAKGFDAVIPILDDRPEPLHALYNKSCVPAIEKQILANDLKIAKFFPMKKVCFVEEEKIRMKDPELTSFLNINTQEDLDKIQYLVSKKQYD